MRYAGPKLKEVGEGVIQYDRNKSATPDIDEGSEPGKRAEALSITRSA